MRLHALARTLALLTCSVLRSSCVWHRHPHTRHSCCKAYVCLQTLHSRLSQKAACGILLVGLPLAGIAAHAYDQAYTIIHCLRTPTPSHERATEAAPVVNVGPYA